MAGAVLEVSFAKECLSLGSSKVAQILFGLTMVAREDFKLAVLSYLDALFTVGLVLEAPFERESVPTFKSSFLLQQRPISHRLAGNLRSRPDLGHRKQPRLLSHP